MRRQFFAPAVALVLAAAPAARAQCCYGPPPNAYSSSYGYDPVFKIVPYGGYFDFGPYINGRLGTNVHIANGPMAGLQTSFALSPYVALVGHFAHAWSNVDITAPNGDQVETSYTDLWLYDGDLQLSAPFYGRRRLVTPFVQLGAGGATYKMGQGYVSASDTRFAWNAGAGVDFQLSRQIGVRFLIKDYITTFTVPSNTPYGLTGRPSNNWAFAGGLSLGL